MNIKLIQELFGNGIINEQKKDELQKEIQTTGKTEEELILEKKIYPESSLFELKSEIFKIPLKKVKVEEIPLEVLQPIIKLLLSKKPKTLLRWGWFIPKMPQRRTL